MKKEKIFKIITYVVIVLFGIIPCITGIYLYSICNKFFIELISVLTICISLLCMVYALYKVYKDDDPIVARQITYKEKKKVEHTTDSIQPSVTPKEVIKPTKKTNKVSKPPIKK